MPCTPGSQRVFKRQFEAQKRARLATRPLGVAYRRDQPLRRPNINSIIKDSRASGFSAPPPVPPPELVLPDELLEELELLLEDELLLLEELLEELLDEELELLLEELLELELLEELLLEPPPLSTGGVPL